MKHFILFLFLIVLACTNKEVQNDNKLAQNANRPNIVLIVSDDQGYRDLGCFGATDVKTPTLDKLAEEGVRLTNFYVTCSFCTPSRSSLLTGRYPQRNGTYELFRNDRVNDGYLYQAYEYSVSPERILGTDLREVLISEVLKDAGYVNACFGKWDLGQLKRFLPLQQGFDRYYGHVNTGIDYFTHERYGVPSMYDDNEPTIKDKGVYCTDLFEREALKFLNENIDKPFFLYLPFNAPHYGSNQHKEDPRYPVQATQEYLDMYPEYFEKGDYKRQGTLAAITDMDNAIGNILKVIEDAGKEENTLVIFLSDNGAGTGKGVANYPLRGGKGNYFEGGIRVPCIIKWPGKINENLIIENFVSSLEIFPTILSAAGIDKNDSVILDGFDLMPLLSRENEKLERQEMYWESRGKFAARIGNWKIVDNIDEKGFFDLSTDISERNDLTTIQSEKFEEIKLKFKNWQTEMAKAEPRGPFKDY
ncbi:MAG: sulfatase-like hydrolase/transferase [Prolixibacteraceae bacterium]|jgi:arylsulfatase A-like enzyme|nr:sulfatase-like hydrolase/transferase [Prolixibacteraceae bacterium]MBT6007146.1 sulfatase-like hydrolase/transferase [Prolixibacteraceae bacterium]MBT6764662.1 sulfatase-like hydrolase/transferase [Prolixibacteraceae bacterium]MBT6998486.1 sulfatase-like hydrolase/transferase [Prolixibacteraceae bacterium]MBT7397127.1 sulfatase-like hydrolase/transferase [Prolixibacteraceae bacterium]